MRDDPRTRLDAPEVLAEADPGGMLALVEGMGQQWRTAAEASAEFSWPPGWREKKRVVVAGMGGSAIAADFASAALAPVWPVAVHVVRDYHLPAWVDESDLLVACSYSGNTEETLSVWHEAGEKGIERAAISTGGELGDAAAEAGLPLYPLPGGFPPRAAFPSSLVTLYGVLAGVGPGGDDAPGGETTRSHLVAIADLLERLGAEYGAERKVLENPAKEIALWLGESWPVIYAPDRPLGPVAVRWRGQLAENAKRVSSVHVLPEMNHNEIVGWQVQEVIYPATRVLMFEDPHGSARLQRRIDVTAELLQRAGAPVRRVAAGDEGDILARMVSLSALGDFVSVYLALGWRLDPTPVDTIDYLKSKLAEVHE